jgi:hypothetical protein
MVNGEDKGKGKMSMYFLCLCENRTMKFVEIILNIGVRMRENDGGDESNESAL